jgi:hypothetical protein
MMTPARLALAALRVLERSENPSWDRGGGAIDEEDSTDDREI